MENRFAGKVAVVTGGANGIGRAAALRFLDEGARVVIGDLNAAAAAEAVELAAQAGHGDRIRFIATDVAREDDVAAMIDLAVSAFGRLDCVFNNAGLVGAIGPISDLAVDDWDSTVAVLLRGVFLGMKHGARVLKAQGTGGAIVNTASVAGLSGGEGPQAYSASKAAVINLTRAVAVELAPHRIRVNAVCPGAILTPLVHRGSPEAAESMLQQLQPWPEAGKPEHVAGVALFLASEDARFVTGAAVVVDGGLTAAGANIIRSFGPAGIDTAIAGMDYGSTGRDSVFRALE